MDSGHGDPAVQMLIHSLAVNEASEVAWMAEGKGRLLEVGKGAVGYWEDLEPQAVDWGEGIEEGMVGGVEGKAVEGEEEVGADHCG
mmetsp:Transcript_40849/g.49576  ORF Transcript_40849/g.49576 Transcript_40849/m.49576 type:complete len:86 (+) Transcript_40849:472-729(+)